MLLFNVPIDTNDVEANEALVENDVQYCAKVFSILKRKIKTLMRGKKRNRFNTINCIVLRFNIVLLNAELI